MSIEFFPWHFEVKDLSTRRFCYADWMKTMCTSFLPPIPLLNQPMLNLHHHSNFGIIVLVILQNRTLHQCSQILPSSIFQFIKWYINVLIVSPKVTNYLSLNLVWLVVTCWTLCIQMYIWGSSPFQSTSILNPCNARD